MPSGDNIVENLDEDTRKPPKTRIKDAASVRELHSQMVRDDDKSQGKRNEVQSMLDGKPPYDAAVLESSGQGGITNLDFGEGEAIHEAGVNAMLDIVNSVEDLVVVPLKRGAVDDQELQKSYEQMLATEASRTIREWDGFDFAYQALVGLWYDHGVGINYFDDCYNWQWEVAGLGEFVIPRRTRASESKIPYASCVRGYQLHEIWAKIEDAETAEAAGWNVDAVKDAMLKCAQVRNTSVNNWEDVETGLRNNDFCTSGKAEEVRVIHMWVKQFDGTVSLYLTTESETASSTTSADFLYEKHGAHRAMREAFTFFCYGIGTNRTYHGIVGQMHKVYPMIQYLNRNLCSFMDAAKMAASEMLQPANEGDLGNLALVTYGNYTILPSTNTMNFIPRVPPNLQMNLVPAMDVMRQMMDKRTGQVDMTAPYANQNEKTALEVRTTLGQQARVGRSNLALFIPPWGRHCREVIRRLCRPDYDISLPGGPESQEMRMRLQEQGFPLELLAKIDFDAVTCTQAVGAGSPAARGAAMAELEPMVAGYDTAGQHNFKRDKTAAALGSYKAADRYIPKMLGDTRPPQDKQFALLENGFFQLSVPQQVVINQLHTVHLDNHLPFLMNMVDIAEQNLEEGVPLAQPMALCHDHCVNHLEPIQADPMIQEKTALYRQALQQAGEVIGNVQRHVEKLQRKAEEEQAAEGQQGGGLTPEQLVTLQENNVKLQIMRDAAELKAAIKWQEFAQKKALQDAAMAVKLSNDVRTTNAKIALAKQTAAKQP